MMSNSTYHRYTESTQRGRSRSPVNGPATKQGVHSAGARQRPRSPPLMAEHNTGRFPSPGSARHRFVRDNVEERRTIDVRYQARKLSPHSPDARFSSRDDAVRRHSPISRRYSENYTNWNRNAGSPNTPCDRPMYRSDAQQPERNRSIGGTINFGGLRDVPTGPRRSISGIHEAKRDYVTPCPCIFISLRYIPNLPRLIKHLNGMLGSLRPTLIDIDDYGWNLVYDDSPNGLEKLTLCFERYNKELFFNEYELCMLCYPNGKQPRPQPDVNLHSSGGTDGSSALRLPHQRPDNTVVPKFDGFDTHQTTYHEPIKSLETKSDAAPPGSGVSNPLARTPSHVAPDNATGQLSDILRQHETPFTGTNTSLLSLRSDRDETGSLGSGVTRSDSSRAKCNRCHRCKGEAVPGGSILVRCSTCPRQYHRRCHQEPAIPTYLSDTHDWSCAPCVKKGRVGKGMPKADDLRPLSNDAEPVIEAETVSKNTTDEQQSERSHGHGPIAMGVDGASDTQLQLLRSDSKSPQNEMEREGEPTANKRSDAIDEHATLSDADDLVAKSFAEDQSHSKARSQKSGKLKITRTKLPPRLPNTTTQQSQVEVQSSQTGSTAADAPAAKASSNVTEDASANEVIARNSVADLRALAHERHQTAIRNAAEGQVAGEEQRVRHNASGNTARSLVAHQSPNVTQVLQQASTMELSSAAPAVAKDVAEREIPESPDELRRSGVNYGRSTKDQGMLPPARPLTQDVVISSATRTSNINPRHEDRPPTLMRPRAPSAVVRCERCQKPIPRGPTGRNKLCSGCKRDMAAAASDASGDAKLAPQSSAAPIHKSVAPVANMGTSPQTSVAPADLGALNVEVTDNEQEQGVLIANDRIVRLACDTCRKRHTRCTHNSSTAHAPTPSLSDQQVENTTSATKVIPARDDDDKDGDSRTQAAPDENIVHNALADEILGELQFAPTAQMQLREEPSMTEFKIHQLKKILDENVTARTDMSVLAVELEHVLTRLRKRSHMSDQTLDSIDSASPADAALTEAGQHEAATSEATRLGFIKSVVGDSFDRPKGSRLTLVAMALGSTASRRMQAKDVMDWIANTIPGYTRGEGNWSSRISAQLSQGRLLSSGSGYWREEEWQEGDGGKPKSKWYQLLPEKEDDMWTWCPVLKEPLSPSARREAQNPGKAARQGISAPTRVSTAASTSAPVTPLSSKDETVSIYCGSFVQGEDSKRLDAAGVEAAGDVFMETNRSAVGDPHETLRGQKRKYKAKTNMTNLFTPEKNGASSSEDEPLSAMTKRRRGETLSQDRIRLPAAEQYIPAGKRQDDRLDREPGANTAHPEEREDRISGGPGSVNKILASKSGLVALHLSGARRSSIAGTPDSDLSDKREQLATSLYDEWPEFHEHASDGYEKLTKIRERLKKKQLFGKSAPTAKVRSQKDSFEQTITPCNFSPEKRSRTTMADPRPDAPYPWEEQDFDPTRKEYASLEEFFDFPDNMIPIISEGQLAYRDGTRTDDGRLPRAREIFKP